MIEIWNLIVHLLSSCFSWILILIVIVSNMSLVKTRNVVSWFLNLITNCGCMGDNALHFNELISKSWIKSSWMNKISSNVALEIDTNLDIGNLWELLATAFSIELPGTSEHFITWGYTCHRFSYFYVCHEHILDWLSEKWNSLEWRANDEMKEINTAVSNRFQIESHPSNVFTSRCNLRYLLVVMKGLLLRFRKILDYIIVNLGLGVVVMYLVSKLGQLVLLEWLCDLGN